MGVGILIYLLGLIYETLNGMVKLVEGLLLLGYKSALSSLLPIFCDDVDDDDKKTAWKYIVKEYLDTEYWALGKPLVKIRYDSRIIYNVKPPGLSCCNSLYGFWTRRENIQQIWKQEAYLDTGDEKEIISKDMLRLGIQYNVKPRLHP